MNKIGDKDFEVIAKILKENITYSGQIGDYVIHGAIEKIISHFKPNQTEGSTGVDNKTRIEKEGLIYSIDHYDEPNNRTVSRYSYIAGATAEQERSYNKGWNDAIEAVIKKLGEDINQYDHIERYWPTLKPELTNLKIANR